MAPRSTTVHHATTTPRRGRRLRPTLIAATVAVAPIERIDLLGGTGPFVLTPYLLLAPLLVVVALASKAHAEPAGPTAPPPSAKVAVATLSALVAAAWTSTWLNGASTTGIMRSVLLLVLVSSAWSLVRLIRLTPSSRSVRAGAWAGLVAFAVFDLYQWSLFQNHGLLGPEFTFGIVDTKLTPYGDGVVRLSGGARDANLGAMTVAFYTYLLTTDPSTALRRSALRDSFIIGGGFLLTALTLSRSGLLVFLVVLAGAGTSLLRRQRPYARVGTIVALSLIGTLGLRGSWQNLLGLRSAATARLDLNEASAQNHIALIERGVQIATRDWRLFPGHGYGDSHLFLQDFFPGNDYGNFHSLYVMMLVEAGLIGLLAVIVLLLGAVKTDRLWLILGVIAFNSFYQTNTSPLLWIPIAMAWALPSSRNLPSGVDRARHMHHPAIKAAAPESISIPDRYVSGR